MRANEFTNHRVMAKIESTGKIVQILRHADQVQFSDKPGWFLINTEPDRRMGNIKWIPDSTRFTWVKNFESLKERQQTQFQGLDLSLTVEKDDEYVDDDDTENQTVSITASSGGRELGHVLFTIDYDSEGMILLPQDLEVDERYRGQGIARVMYDYAKSQGYRIRRSGQQTDAGRGFWQKHRPQQNVWESQRRLPAAIEEFLDSLNPDDCGVEDIGAYRIHFEGFTSDCKSSADYRRDPEAVYQQVYRDFIHREGGQKPVIQDMVGDERFPILFSIFRHRQKVAENQQATAKQILSYINKTHHEPFRPGEKMYAAVMAHPRWELKKVPLLNLNIPDEEYDDVDYYDNPPESDPYGRVMTVEPGHAGEVSQYLIDKNPIVIDADRYIIDGNHRAWAAKYLLNRDYIQAWVPVEQIKEVNYPDELTISDRIQDYFYKRGYQLAGEGRDQMAFESPRGTIVKVLGTGDPERENIVRNYVTFFERNQRNPFYPRIYSSGEFTVDGETYFVYEMERVNYVANEEATLDYIEGLMSAVDREQGEKFLQQNPVPREMTEQEIFGLIQATEDMIQALGGQAPLDLNSVENLGRRDNGHLVIVDPYSL